ncbi:MAG: D-alanyl-D-alanine carboxypeptidase/D-alanyl-D-alanine-endopeptidase [Bacteroidetes bacterium]|nr:MAG: D-alanyl-D-alanine carboxypeptidase/D-alanyl-D-alanine-endopeptidase [Bacteroidota bacterium]
MQFTTKLGVCLAVFFCQTAWGQPTKKLNALWSSFENDSQLQYGIAGMCVLDTATGAILFERNAKMGLTPASTQKVLTSIAAYEALGKQFRYGTRLGYEGQLKGDTLVGDLLVAGSGDPSLGSPRYGGTKPDVVLAAWAAAVKKLGLSHISGALVAAESHFDLNPLPDAWTWSDMGNYYGAGAFGLNWKENQYDLFFDTKNPGTKAQISRNTAAPSAKNTINQVVAGSAGTGDGSVIFAAPYGNTALIQGKLEPQSTGFSVSGASTAPDAGLLADLKQQLATAGVTMPDSARLLTPLQFSANQQAVPVLGQPFYTHDSPPLDSLIYWFMKKSINLYGEALLRTIGQKTMGFGSNDAGLKWVDSFYAAMGIDKRALHLTDGSGLSGNNRIAPLAMATALNYARTRPWFSGFYHSFPVYNGMTIKSGTIHRTKCFAGYHGKYVVVLMVNNYNGSTSALVSKMFAVLNGLK